MALAEREIVQNDETADDARPLLWTKEQYYKMGEMGLFGDARVELIEGEIIEMPPIGTRHFTSVGLATQVLNRIFGENYCVMPQNSFNAGPGAEPQPDIAVYEGNIRDFADALPTTALLVVEVADSTLHSDRTRKAKLYAGRGIQDYWIINLRGNLLEVHRQPTTRPDQPVAYKNVLTLTADDAVAPLAAPNSPISVADLLP